MNFSGMAGLPSGAGRRVDRANKRRKTERRVKAGRQLRILVLEGDGIGPEITAATLAVLRATDAKFGLGLAFERAAIGWAAHKATGTTFPDMVEAKAKAADGVLLGPVSHNDYPSVPKAGSIRPANCASGSISTPISGRRGRARASRRVAARSRSGHRAREH